MIKYLKYRFVISPVSSEPVIQIDHGLGFCKEESYGLQREINDVSSSVNLKKIVKNLEKIESGELDEYDFGFETTLVHCYNKGKSYYGEMYPNTQVSISYEYGDKHVATDLKVKDILKMMTEWRDYVLNWEKETGKIKK